MGYEFICNNGGMLMFNPFPYSVDNKRYHTYSYALTKRFGQKVSRISLNAGFTCPNLDGTYGNFGCAYCSDSGSGEFAGNPQKPISEQFEQIAKKMSEKWETSKHIAYFQPHTNTYASVDKLRKVYEQALCCSGVVGVSIATRPDCLPDDVCDLLEELSHRTYLTVELGLQTIHDQTAIKINRCHTLYDFINGYKKLKERSIFTGIHIINGLPGETSKMMQQTAELVAELNPHLLKIHLLHVVQGTQIEKWYQNGEFSLLDKETYVDIVCNQLEILPQECIIGRLTGDGDPKTLIGPLWSLKKLCVLNDIDKEFIRRESWQGKYRYVK